MPEIWHSRDMRRIRLSMAQRIVIVVALGLGLAVLGVFLTRLGRPLSGWYGYAPLTPRLLLVRQGIPGWGRLLIWLALIGLWALASVFVLRPARDGAEPGGPAS